MWAVEVKETYFFLSPKFSWSEAERAKKRTSEEVLILRSNPVDISREHRAFLDVGDAEEASGDALQADGEAAVRGHAVAEGVEVETESIRVHATTEHLLAVFGCSVLRSLSSALCSPLCPSRAPQARIPRTPHGISAPDRAHPATHRAALLNGTELYLTPQPFTIP